MSTTLTTTPNAAHFSGPNDAPTPSATEHRVAGVTALAGVVLCLVGVVLNQVIVDVDAWAAMEASSRAEQADLLERVAADRTPIIAGLAVWMIAFPLVCMSSVLLARLGRRSSLTQFVQRGATAAMGAILVVLSAFITFVAVIAPAHVAGEDVYMVARGIGWMATTTDWVVTAVVLGLAPIGAVYAGRDRWAPRWLQGIAAIAALAAILLGVGLVSDVRGLVYPLVPIGLVLVACSGVCALRHQGS
jgi:hypothetical protein